MAAGSPQSGVGRIVAGRYLLVEQVGSGGMGHVWRAHDQRLDCDVALKEIRFRNPQEGVEEHESRIARARAEARHAAVLRGHPHVVTVHDVLEFEGLPWIVMEYVAGAEDLRDWLARRGPLAPDECARVGLAVLDALTAGHERGIMHRDVKPANILLAPDRAGTPGARILLTDYGISVQPDSLETRWTMTSVLVGTAGYLAPERVTGGPPTAAADLFSLGCTLYFGVEGHGPFGRDTDLAAITAVVLEDPPPPRRAGALWPVVEALLHKDPAHRISAQDTAAALARIITPQPHPPTQVDPGSQPPWAGLVTSDGPGSGSPVGDQGLAAPGGYPPTAEGSASRDQGFAAPGAYPPTAQAPGAYTPTAGAPGAYTTPTAGAPDPYAPTAHARGAYTPLPGQGFGPPGYGGPPASALGPPGRRRRKRPRLLQALAAVLLALGLTAGGVWYAMAHKAELPYGDTVGLSEPLRRGDCVVGDPHLWKAATVAHLRLDPTCEEMRPEAQVMELYKFRSYEAARHDGAHQCQERTKDTADRLAWNVKSMAVVPTREGFEATGGTVACLLAGKSSPVYGPLGDLRSYGMTFQAATQMQRGDCLGHAGGDARVITHFELVACDKPHGGRVVQITHLTAYQPDEDPDAQADDQCERDARPEKYHVDPTTHWSHGLHSEGLWADRYYLVVCSLEQGQRPPQEAQ
ncbi:protein kinase [Streptomyces sp. NPDC048415]|uniref:serine/threonine-protein kinase n=1 Tax=Streptomyces sp. NPDC048415 TaxID=3154822 RepID=UPI003432B1D3